MLLSPPCQAALSRIRVVLGSGSPRRVECLSELLGGRDAFEVVVSAFEETLPHSAFPGGREYCLATARGKAGDVARGLGGKMLKEDNALGQAGSPNKAITWVVAADTVVALESGRILEKPRDEGHAVEMLTMLSGVEHHVHTAVLVVEVTRHSPFYKELFSFVSTTKVRFGHLSQEEIKAYVATGEPMDKAGGYGIQGKGRALVESISGDFFNVTGFPAREFATRFAEELLKQSPR